MNLRVAVPVVLALAAAGGVVVGGIQPGPTPASSSASPQSSGSASPTAQDWRALSVTTPPKPQPAYDVVKLAPGERPPQFVTIAFDGSCETNDKLFRHYLDLADRNDAKFTFFLSGLCQLPDNKQRLFYQPPGHARGTSAIGFGDPELVKDRIETMREAYDKGHEIGSHFLGHFCGPTGVQQWTTAQWSSEIRQFNEILDNWKRFNPDVDAEPLPFDSSVVHGVRTPCLEGQRPQMYPAFVKAGYTYDTSNPVSYTWPRKIKPYGLWDFGLPSIRIAGRSSTQLSMDYNFLYELNNAQTDAAPAQCKKVEDVTYQSFMDALESAYEGSRAPFNIGNHFNMWACGAFRNAITRFVDDAKKRWPDVQFVSFQDLEDWMNAQDPQVVKKLRKLPSAT